MLWQELGGGRTLTNYGNSKGLERDQKQSEKVS
jgi:hypothetical protein